MWVLATLALLLTFPAARAVWSTDPSDDIVITGPDLIRATRLDAIVDVRLDPVDRIDSPYTADDVIKTSMSEGVVLGDPTAAHVQYGSLTSETLGETEAGVWVIDFEGVCIPNLGPEGNGGGACIDDRLTVIVDGKTGEWLTSYAVRN